MILGGELVPPESMSGEAVKSKQRESLTLVGYRRILVAVGVVIIGGADLLCLLSRSR